MVRLMINLHLGVPALPVQFKLSFFFLLVCHHLVNSYFYWGYFLNLRGNVCESAMHWVEVHVSRYTGFSSKIFCGNVFLIQEMYV